MFLDALPISKKIVNRYMFLCRLADLGWLNFYHDSLLWNIVTPIGQYLKRYNPTRCATHTEGVRVCVDMDISKEPLLSLWIGIPRQANSFIQEVKYETLLAYYLNCCMQGHNSRTCKWKPHIVFEKILLSEGGKKKINEFEKNRRKSLKIKKKMLILE